MLKSFPLLLALAAGTAAAAATPAALLQGYAGQARQADPAFEPSASRGAAFFRLQRAAASGHSACTDCHTDDPRQPGRTRAHKAIAPLAPVANPERLADAAKTEKWLGRNCRDVVGRPCTAAEKADIAAWLISIR